MITAFQVYGLLKAGQPQTLLVVLLVLAGLAVVALFVAVIGLALAIHLPGGGS